MKRIALLSAFALACSNPPSSTPAPATANTGAYRVVQRARVGGEGGLDYIFADAVGRRIYVARNGARAVAATETSPARAAVPGRVSVYDIETLALVGEIANTGGNGVAIDPTSGHGFSSSRPPSMFDTKTLTLIKTIDVAPGTAPDGILFDGFNDRVYVFSHPTKNATVIDSKSGAVLGTVDLGGTPEQAVSDGKGTMYVVMQDMPGGVAVVDTKTMKTTAHYPFPDIGRCNGLALDAKNHVLFASCAQSGTPAPQPPQPTMVVMDATNGAILAKLPLAGSSDGTVFNPATMEAFSSHSNGTLTIVAEQSPTSFVVKQNLETMNGARTLSLDTKTNHVFVMSVERGAAPPPPAGGGRGGQAPAVPGSFTILKIGK